MFFLANLSTIFLIIAEVLHSKTQFANFVRFLMKIFVVSVFIANFAVSIISKGK